EEGESLTTILTTVEDRSALTVLVAECTEAMRQTLLATFDAKETGTTSDLVANIKPQDDASTSKPTPSEETPEQKAQAQQDLQRREKELSATKLQELKEAALNYFDQWNSAVLGRVGEAINSRAEPPPPKAAKPQSPHEETPPGAVPPQRFQDPSEYDVDVDKTLVEQYPPVQTSLSQLQSEKKALIIHSVLLLLLSLEHYHAHSRVLLLHLTTSLGLTIKHLAADENKVARGLLAVAENLQADEETKKQAKENKSARKWKVGLAGVAGAALIGVTGGLAAPLLAAGLGTVMGGLGLGATAAAGYLGSLAGSAVLVGGLFGAYGGRMTSQMMDKYAREVEDFAFVPVQSTHRPRKIEKEYRRLRVGIGISGWLTNKEDVVEPWKVIGVELESFALRWELEALMNLGNGLLTLVKSAAWGFAKREIIKQTVFAALMAGLWPLGLLKVSRIVENPWSVASYRAQKAGEVLADALINKAQGERPVTLVGYSLGAKVIYTCLQRLAERKAFGLIESVVLIGSPSPAASADWRVIRTVVAGRVVNVYSTEDYLLAYLYRTASIQYGVAGLQAIENVKGIENIDVTSMSNGHTNYRFLTGHILKKIGFENVDMEQLRNEEKALEEEQKKEEQVVEGGDSQNGDVSEEYVQGLEKEVEQKNEQSYMGWAQEKMMAAGTSASAAYEKARSQIQGGQG
ncbi:hypothetical protein BDY17DRAFT_235012, partial [Neohortaea acidophila]